LQTLQAIGFSTTWRDWVSALLSSASTKVLLNGAPGERVCHAHDLRQGDSLSPLFFLLIMEVMSTMFRRADDWSLLQPLSTQTIPHRVSLYADDMVMFLARGSRISSLLVIFYRCSRTCPALVAIWQSANWPRSVILRSKLKWRSPSSHARRCISPSNI
jgi:hypothetical protein